MEKTKLQEILDKHLKWLLDEPDGERADLYGADLRGANLYGANLRDAYLCGANLYGANLRDANLYGADLRGAYLCGANLRDANLCGANLYGADLRGAKEIEKALNLFYPIACPSDGAFIGWKKAKCGGADCIVKLRIIESARRSSATGRKCRCDMAEVLEVQTIDGEKIDGVAQSDRDAKFLYKVGETVFVSDYCANRWEECAAGIHFYITREEAARHSL